MNLVSPIYFSSNRVCDTHKGGELLDSFLDCAPVNGEKNAENFAAEWLASVESSSNSMENPQEGISAVINESEFGTTPLPEFLTANADSVFGADFIIRYGREFPLQLRLIDTNERLPIQCASKPKTWIVVDINETGGTEP